MFCEAYDQSLRDAAASGEALSATLQQHIVSCDACRAAFAEEQTLFAAIDSVLHAANSEVPSTLIPRVRVAINNEPAPQGRSYSFIAWSSASLLLTAAIVLAVLYLPSSHRPTLVVPSRPFPIVAAKNSQDRALNPAPPSGVSAVQQKKPVILVTNRGLKPVTPEVLVPPDEGAALARYEEFLRRKQAVVLIASAKSIDLRPGIEPLQIAEIEFVDLKIPALSKWESEDDTK